MDEIHIAKVYRQTPLRASCEKKMPVLHLAYISQFVLMALVMDWTVFLPNPFVEAITPNVTASGYKLFKEFI